MTNAYDVIYLDKNTIRAYERKAKDIRKAQMDIVLRLTDGLQCRIEDIL